MTSRTFKIFAALITLLLLQPISVGASQWDFVYDSNPSSANDVSSFTSVRIDPLGGIFLTGYFYGQFENLASNGQWVRFAQHRSANGSVDWTVPLETVPGVTPPNRLDWHEVDGDGTLFIAGFGSVTRTGITTANRIFCWDYLAGTDSGLIALCPDNSNGVSLRKLDSTFAVVWDTPLTDAPISTQIFRGPGNSVWATWNLNSNNLGSTLPLPQDFRAALAMKKFSTDTGSQITAIKHFGINAAPYGASWTNTLWLSVSSGSFSKNTAFRVDNGQMIGEFPNLYGLLGPFTSITDTSFTNDPEKISRMYTTFARFFPPYVMTGPVIEQTLAGCLIQTLAFGGNFPAQRFRSNMNCPNSGSFITQFTNDGRRLIIAGGRRLWVIEFNGEDIPQPVRNVLSKEFDSTIEDFDADDFGNIYVAGSTFTSVVSSASTDERRAQNTFANQRAFITRNPGGRIGLTVLPRTPLRFKVTGSNGVPSSGVGAVSMNVTVTTPRGEGFITAYPCDSRPDASNLNYVLNQTVPNAVIAPVSADGEVCFYTYAETHLIADVNGYFPTGSGFVSNIPARVIDTRVGAAQGLRTVSKTKVGNGTELRVQFTNLPGGITPASGVGAVSLNVTVTGSQAPNEGGFVTVYPCGDRPDASNLNFRSGQTVPNAVITPVSANGDVCFYVFGSTDLIADINGYFPGGAGFVATEPVRVADTRPGAAQGLRTVTKQRIGGNTTLQLQLTNLPGGITPSSGIGAVSLNVTAVNTTANQFGGYVTTYPCGTIPDVSSLNFVSNQIVPNAVIAPLSANGTICFYAYGRTDLIVDLNGYFPTGAGFVPVNPKRLFDTR